VCIFRTANGRGWGVKAMQKIKKGSFVMEYVGEVGKLKGSFMGVNVSMHSGLFS